VTEVRSPIDFSGKTVLVIGGSSGIGNGIARGFLDSGAEVHIWGTKESPESYAGGDGNFNRLHYQQMNAADPGAIEAFNPPFKKLDVLVQSQGIILYSRGEFEVKGFRRVLEVNLVSLMTCAMKFHPLLVEAQGRLPRDKRQSGLQRFESGCGRPNAYPGTGLGIGWHPRQRNRAGFCRNQADCRHHQERTSSRGSAVANSNRPVWQGGRGGGDRPVSGLSHVQLHRGPDVAGRRRNAALSVRYEFA